MFWVLSEITTYLFVSKISYEKFKNRKTDAPVVYIIMRFLSSAIILLLYSSTRNFLRTILSIDYSENFISQSIQSTIFTSALCIKLGIIPFHRWLYIILEKMRWNRILILSTIQKIIPIWGIIIIRRIQTIFIALIISSIIILFLPLKSFNIYFFLATSTIINNIWIVLRCLRSIITTTIYSLIYFLLTFNLIEIIKKFNLKTFNKFAGKSRLISIFSLIGIPPLLGFFSKIYVIISTNMINLNFSNNLILILIFIVISTTLVSFIYLKSFLPLLTEISSSNLIIKNKTIKLNEIIIINFLSPLILIIVEIIF